MLWNWQLPNWPDFQYDPQIVTAFERLFWTKLGETGSLFQNMQDADRAHFVVRLLSDEGLESAKIEGEHLNRESLQASLRRHFGLEGPTGKVPAKEAATADLLCRVFSSYADPLTIDTLQSWHGVLFPEGSNLEYRGTFRAHPEPMQIISTRCGNLEVFFEAPPSAAVRSEMEAFTHWFNEPLCDQPLLGKAAIAHLYFEAIHPFEDGNGRLGRALVEKMLSKEVGRPILIALSRVLESRRKEYYRELELCNRTLRVDSWVEFFAQAIVEAQQSSIELLQFVLDQARIFASLKDALNPRQEKVLHRMFSEGPKGFNGGLSAEKYIKIAKTSKSTATRDLSHLAQLGVLLRTGELRHTRYWLNLALGR